MSIRITMPGRDEDFTADPVELFFDLGFVFAFSQLVVRLVENHSPEEMGLSALLFMLLWLPWTQFTWTANALSASSRTIRAILLFATAASVPMAASIRSAFEGGGPTFAVALTVIYAAALALLLIGYETGSSEFWSAVRYAIPNGVTVVLLVAGGMVDGDARVVLWIGSLLAATVATVLAGSGDWVVRPGHFAERHGLILIVALGEVIVAIAAPVAGVLGEGEGLSAETVLALAGAGVFAGLLWWGYFDRPQRDFEHRAQGLSAAERGRFARDVYSYLHAPVVAGVIFAAAALEEIALHPKDRLPTDFQWMLVGGLVLYLGGIDGAVYRAFRALAKERLLAIGVIAVTVFVGTDLSGVTLLIIVDAILLITLLFEHRRIEVLPSRQDVAASS